MSKGNEEKPARSLPPGTLERALEEAGDALKERYPKPPRKPRGTKQRRHAGKAALAAVLLLCGLLWLDPAYRTEFHATRAGESARVQLTDGSEIQLDTATRLSISWHLRSRQARLDQGQALFTVAPANWRPFLVAAEPARVRVVGTVFSVRRVADAPVTVSVLQGRVEVRDLAHTRHSPLQLGAGQIARVGGARPPAVLATGLEATTAWREGYLVFESTPLAEVLAEIQRYRGHPVRLVGQHGPGLTLSGVFEIRNTDQLLDLLPRTFPVEIRRLPDGSVEVGPR
ncbi:FecR family protein [Thauera linaloolentis]|uniref:Putative iron transport-sensory transduction protein (FecR) n=1 Tax=Thauera linaloolentis (strain DSM 12138 / JCM 21573 / CCUG 41526 / CIP 105981 / IAM 15112 / NBRC 102519 / 47Lol) TaxID=1123367 RepID=N6YQ13_THAL4|nr:FecR domain-containing protein [Thauera linaloolentis]ENO84318.1 putative iron transport-sensory transduction protein (fecR) [Thauera linaloolentis 47Lol = DSM 12138]MCM8564414.1 FecR domain-containing protein [Thauera linaloolentis]